MKDPFLAAMGNRLVARRKELHLTQEQLAEKASLLPQMISTAAWHKSASPRKPCQIVCCIRRKRRLSTDRKNRITRHYHFRKTDRGSTK